MVVLSQGLTVHIVKSRIIPYILWSNNTSNCRKCHSKDDSRGTFKKLLQSLIIALTFLKDL